MSRRSAEVLHSPSDVHETLWEDRPMQDAERRENFTDLVDRILDEIDEVLEQGFVGPYVHGHSDGGGQYLALVQRVTDRFGKKVGQELFGFISDRTVRTRGRSSYNEADMLRAVAERFGYDVAEYLKDKFVDFDMLTEALQSILGDEYDEEGRQRYEAHIDEAQDSADVHESEAVQLIVRSELDGAMAALQAAMASDPERVIRLRDEFGFLLTQPQPGADIARWVSGLWSILAAKSPMSLESSISDRRVTRLSLNEGERHDDINPASNPEGPADNSVHNAGPLRGPTPSLSPQASGDTLEQSFIAVLRRLFLIDEENESLILKRLRRQPAGSQYGHDIQFDCARSDRETIRCHVECKNKSDLLGLGDVAPKILQTSFHWRDKNIDHLIFIAPRARISSELDLMLQGWRNTREYPFQIQVWSRDDDISDLFALEPAAFEAVYGSPPQAVPSEEIIQGWRDRLKPTLRIPPSVLSYLTDPTQHILVNVDDDKDFTELYGHQVSMRAADELGTPIGDLEKVVRNWLDNDDRRVLLLLGEFGDGKSFFGYTLTRRLAEEYLEAPKEGCLAIRLALSELPGAGDGRQLLERRLRDIGSTYADWLGAVRISRALIILDGLDEMSVQVDPATVANNLHLLSACVHNLPAGKILITSRTHIFEGRRQRDRFLEKLQKPMVLQLTPISRAKRVEHLSTFAKGADLGDKFLTLSRLYDPIGLAAKPLFLQMIKITLPRLPDDRFDQLILYDTYVDICIRRKIELLEDKDLQASHDEIVEALTRILEQVALKLHIEGCEFVDLKSFKLGFGSLSGVLWRITGGTQDDEREEDVRTRVRIRSLLKQAEHTNFGTWPVSFFHRSMREYFVAKAIMRALREDSDNGRRVLSDAVLHPVIVSFLVLMLKSADDLSEMKIRLESHARSAVRGSRSCHLGGNALTLLFRLPGDVSYRGWNGLELDNANLSGADLSGMDFTGSSLRQAIMDNADLTGTNLRGCDLTGVRLEETAPVVALGAGRTESSFVTGYGDGSIREWSTVRLDQSPRSLSESFSGLQSIGLGLDEWLVVLADMHLTVLKEIEGSWQRITRFRVRTDIRDIRVLGERVALLREAIAPGTMGQILLFECASRQGKLDMPVRSLGPFAVLGDTAVALPTASNSIAIEFLLNNNAEAATATVPIEHVSGVALQQSGEDGLVIAVGTLTGRVCLMRAGRAGSECEVVPEWDDQVHEGAVTSVWFLSNEMFVTGGMDRVVAVHEIGRAAARTIHRLQLTIRCAGVQTEGVLGPKERLMFDRLRDSGRLE